MRKLSLNVDTPLLCVKKLSMTFWCAPKREHNTRVERCRNIWEKEVFFVGWNWWLSMQPAMSTCLSVRNPQTPPPTDVRRPQIQCNERPWSNKDFCQMNQFYSVCLFCVSVCLLVNLSVYLTGWSTCLSFWLSFHILKLQSEPPILPHIPHKHQFSLETPWNSDDTNGPLFFDLKCIPWWCCVASL